MTLAEHRRAVNTVNQQRRLLDESYAGIIAKAIYEGYTISEILAERDENQQEFDL